jgi:hypothetical protein
VDNPWTVAVSPFITADYDKRHIVIPIAVKPLKNLAD